MYITVEQARARKDLGLSDVTKFPDEVIEILIKRAQAIVNGYMRQTLEVTSVSGETAEVLSTPDMHAGLMIRLPRRFIIEIKSAKIEYGFGMNDYVLDPCQYFVAKREGYIQTNQGAFYPQMFEGDYVQPYRAVIIYRAGLDPLPEDFLEAFYEVLRKTVNSYDAKFSTIDLTPVSNEVTEIRSLNETVKFAKNAVNEISAKEVFDDYATNILDLYSMPKSGIGVYM